MTKKSFLRGTIIGAVLGSVLGLLIAPMKGEETRTNLKKLIDEVKERVSHEAKLTKERYDQIIDAVVSEYSRDKAIASESLKEIASNLKAKWEEIKKEIREDQ